MILTTTSNIEGHRITEYLGVVTGEAVLGTNLFRDFFAKVRDVICNLLEVKPIRLYLQIIMVLPKNGPVFISDSHRAFQVLLAD